MFKLTGFHKSIGNYQVDGVVKDGRGNIKLESERFVFEGDIPGLLRTGLLLSNPALKEKYDTILTIGVKPKSIKHFSVNESFAEKHLIEVENTVYGLADILKGVSSLMVSENIPLENSLEIHRMADGTPVFIAVCGTELFSVVMPDVEECEYEEDILPDYFNITNPLTLAILTDFQNSKECQDKGFELVDIDSVNALPISEYQDSIVEYYYLSNQLKEIFNPELQKMDSPDTMEID